MTGVSYAQARRKSVATTDSLIRPDITDNEDMCGEDVNSVSRQCDDVDRSRPASAAAERCLVQLDINYKQLEMIPQDDLAEYVEHRNAGRLDAVPECLRSSMSAIDGDIVSLVKVRFPSHVRNGQKLFLRHNGVSIKVKVKEDQAGTIAVFAVYIQNSRLRNETAGLGGYTASAAKMLSSIKFPKMPTFFSGEKPSSFWNHGRTQSS
mmetsp:Transcript_35182/g.71087  ORF Transcript_35182/g.71087 Transcript_35182/m.71087 type:complete len:207 (+) Transcript_35182:3-623(+)